MERIELAELAVEIDDEAKTVTSIWPDGVRLVAAPVDDEESLARAKALGYGRLPGWRGAPPKEAILWAMTRDHDLFHHLVARAEGEPWSWHLRAIAGGDVQEPSLHDGDREERLVFLLQKASRSGADGLLEGAFRSMVVSSRVLATE